MNANQPTLIVDSREQSPLTFRTLPSERGTLQTGDYSVRGCEDLFAIERKSLQDLVGSVTTERGRFERELHRLRGFRFKRLLIVGAEAEIESHRYRGNANPKAVLHSLRAFEVRYDCPVVWQPSPVLAANQVESWAWWFSREVLKAAEGIATHASGPARSEKSQMETNT